MKKLYIQPTTERFSTPLMTTFVDASVQHTKVDGISSEAPGRGPKFI